MKIVSFAGLWLDLHQCISAFPIECWLHNLSEIDPTNNSKAEFCGSFPHLYNYWFGVGVYFRLKTINTDPVVGF